MNKLIPLAALATGTATASSVGIYVSNRKSSDKSTNNQLILESVDAFKEVSDVSKYECLKDYFQNLNIKTKASESSVTEINDTSPGENDFFKDAATSSTPFQSCLLFNWRKTTYTGGKWTGKITWLWTFVKGDEGFINFNVAETSTSEDKKLDLTGLFYLLKKESGSWTIKHKKETLSANKHTVDSSGLDTKFPKASNSIKSSAGGSYWGFFDDSGGMENMVKSGGSGQEGTPTTKKLSWTGKTDGSQSLKDWCEKLDWWTNLFSSSNWKIKSKLENLKGTWSAAT